MFDIDHATPEQIASRVRDALATGQYSDRRRFRLAAYALREADKAEIREHESRADAKDFADVPEAMAELLAEADTFARTAERFRVIGRELLAA